MLVEHSKEGGTDLERGSRRGLGQLGGMTGFLIVGNICEM